MLRNLDRVMHPNLRKEQLSRAWVHAIASIAGFAVYQPPVDDDSIDIVLAEKSSSGTYRGIIASIMGT